MCVKQRGVEALLTLIVIMMLIHIIYKSFDIIDYLANTTTNPIHRYRSKSPSRKEHIIESQVVPTAENRSNNEKILVYNRVPKCGSSTLKLLVKLLAKENEFKSYSSRTYFRRKLSLADEKELVGYIRKQETPYFFDRHFYIFDMDKYDLKVDLINMVRDPVDRVVSNFYFVRNPSRWEKKETVPPDSWFSKNFNKCVLQGDAECQIGFGVNQQEMQLTYFCGSTSVCFNTSSRAALQKAKKNLETRYSVVGVMEWFNASLSVLENYLPRWFRGAADNLYRVSRKQYNHVPHQQPSKNAKKVLGERLKLDFDFFEFVKQRLAFQLKALELKSEYK